MLWRLTIRSVSVILMPAHPPNQGVPMFIPHDLYPLSRERNIPPISGIGNHWVFFFKEHSLSPRQMLQQYPLSWESGYTHATPHVFDWREGRVLMTLHSLGKHKEGVIMCMIISGKCVKRRMKGRKGERKNINFFTRNMKERMNGWKTTEE